MGHLVNDISPSRIHLCYHSKRYRPLTSKQSLNNPTSKYFNRLSIVAKAFPWKPWYSLPRQLVDVLVKQDSGSVLIMFVYDLLLKIP